MQTNLLLGLSFSCFVFYCEQCSRRELISRVWKDTECVWTVWPTVCVTSNQLFQSLNLCSPICCWDMQPPLAICCVCGAIEAGSCNDTMVSPGITYILLIVLYYSSSSAQGFLCWRIVRFCQLCKWNCSIFSSWHLFVKQGLAGQGFGFRGPGAVWHRAQHARTAASHCQRSRRETWPVSVHSCKW